MIKNKLHQQRWDGAKALFGKLKDKAEYFKFDIMYDGMIIKPEQVVIAHDEIYVGIDDCRYIQFEANSDCDEGCYTTIKEYRKEIKEQFKLVKVINW